jgi:hypothetical protein
VALEASGPDPVVLVLNGDMERCGSRGGPLRSFDFEGGSSAAVLVDGEKVQRVRVPELKVVNETTAPPDLHLLIKSVWRQVPVPGGWLLVTWDGLHVIGRDGPRYQSTLHPALEHPVGAAIDEKTGLLVLIGGRGHDQIELFDVAANRSVSTLDVPAGTLRYDVAARDGRAWVAMSDGSVLVVDLLHRRVDRSVRVAEGTKVSLALSQSGRLLATATEVPRPGGGPPLVMVGAWETRDAELHPLAESEFPELPAVNDIAVLPDDRTVLIAGHNGLWVWRAMSDAGGTRLRERPDPGASPQDQDDEATYRDQGSDGETTSPTKVPVPLRGEDFHLEITAAHFVSPLDSGPPRKARCTIRLCRADGQAAGPASMGRARPRGEFKRDGWAADFADGEEVELLFRRESDGMFWRVVVVPEFEAAEIRWSVSSATLICIR